MRELGMRRGPSLIDDKVIWGLCGLAATPLIPLMTWMVCQAGLGATALFGG